MLNSRWVRISLFILLVRGPLAHATIQCFFALHQNEPIAQRFARDFLPGTRVAKPINHANIDLGIANWIFDEVKRAQRIVPADQAADFLGALPEVDDAEVPTAAVRASFATPRFTSTDEPVIFRYFPPELPRAEIVKRITQNLLQNAYTVRETHPQGRNRAAEMVVEMNLNFDGGRVYPVRVAIVLPIGGRVPELSLVTLLISPELNGRMICVYRNPITNENLVITKWEKGEPKKGIVVGPDVVSMPFTSRDYAELFEDAKTRPVVADFDRRNYGEWYPRDLGHLPPAENMYRESIVLLLGIRGQIHLFREPRENLAGFPYPRFLMGTNAFEAAAVMRALPIMEKVTRDSDPVISFFPPNLKGYDILASLEAKIRADDFIVRPTGRFPKTMNALTTLTLGGENYPVSFSLAFPDQGLDGIVSLVGLRPAIGEGTTNHTVVVYRHSQTNQYLVITRWQDGKPAEAAVVPGPGHR